MAINDTREVIIAKRGYRKDIKGDQYSLYLSNYPISTRYLAGRLENKGKILVELCSGVGVTIEALSNKFEKLICVELDPEILEYCRQNMKSAGLMGKVDLIQGDITDEDLLKNIKADVVIYDIPYWVSKELPGRTNVLDKNPDLNELIDNVRKYITDNIVVFAPRYLEYSNIKNSAVECEFQKIYINGKHDRNYIFFGNLIENQGITEQKLSYDVTQS